ncbi:hypothetical protein [Pseudomonas nitroreducens]|uniref:Uncharacterized protein n=1 Tax=Pseudomonas nitroreducens TaxID=46680 RepID=A0A6G6IQB3_PSENT|nr:hypothetical protein [Pseudomonas nitroreducens]MBG6286562.1 hypothetical protein [Pseudomonas nitroreducens]MCJ1878760.1 hypothetical protein [Pseudomonas nitroreducens]MCJ1896426.1 hypothetical protein [Pseudomonas nitroreducens]MDH1071811.1 hypothetical protein [Pseudomonas nitroreducens]NMZ59658.1 hypothetical protein [Pseudomonas nitroreducens]
MPRLRPVHGMFFLVIALLAFGLGTWVARTSAPPKPPQWFNDWKEKVFEPLAEDHLSLSDLQGLQPGELWLTASQDGPQLHYRGRLVTDEGPWHVEAELALSEAEHASLAKATGMQPTSKDQPLSAELMSQLGNKPVSELALAPQEDLAVGRLAVSLGDPRLRLQVEGGEAWVYPEKGMTLLHRDGTLQWIRVVPRNTLKVSETAP